MNDFSLLSKIPGQYISAGMRGFPDAATATDEFQESVVDVPGIGKVHFTYKRFLHKKGRSRLFFWTVENAVLMAR